MRSTIAMNRKMRANVEGLSRFRLRDWRNQQYGIVVSELRHRRAEHAGIQAREQPATFQPYWMTK
jgi:hypothetical protein